MLQYVDATLYQLFATGLTTLRRSSTGAVTPDQIGFQAPDGDWRKHVHNLMPLSALNVYLIDLRENRRLRSDAHLHTTDPVTHVVTSESAPARVACHYLITAWSNATEDVATPPTSGAATGTAEEHAILYEVIALLMANQPLVPADVFAPAHVPAAFPPLLVGASLPTDVVPVEGFHKYAEFWGTIGVPHTKWKPAVYLIVTVPVAFPSTVGGFMVTTRMTWYRIAGAPASAYAVTQIGGRVAFQATGSTTATPVGDAWVRLEQLTGEPVGTATSDALGHFTFEDVQWGSYTLRARAASHAETTRTPVQVPATAIDGYDITFT